MFLGDRHFSVSEFANVQIDIGSVTLHGHDMQVTAKRSGMNSAQRKAVCKACHNLTGSTMAVQQVQFVLCVASSGEGIGPEPIHP